MPFSQKDMERLIDYYNNQSVGNQEQHQELIDWLRQCEAFFRGIGDKFLAFGLHSYILGLEQTLNELIKDELATDSIETENNERWVNPYNFNNLMDFDQIHFFFDYVLTEDDYDMVFNCVKYAFKEILHADDAALTKFKYLPYVSCTGMKFNFDLSKCRSDDPEIILALKTAELYVREGSPIRLTNRGGDNTKGTRLYSGIGRCGILNVQISDNHYA